VKIFSSSILVSMFFVLFIMIVIPLTLVVVLKRICQYQEICDNCKWNGCVSSFVGLKMHWKCKMYNLFSWFLFQHVRKYLFKFRKIWKKATLS
jgi:hypothetical protein